MVDFTARYVIRGAGPEDLEQLLALAGHLNTVNLPNDREHIAELLEHSERSFSGAFENPWLRKYVFVLRDEDAGRAVGTSTIVAQLGRKDAPYLFFDVIDEERYSATLDRHFSHKLLRLGLSYDGPTELAGLVVDPSYRSAPERLGILISYVRFLYIAAHPASFRDQLLAELLPPLEPDGRSHLWEALGRRFTDMSYSEADLLSSRDKTFVRDLFPSSVIYTALLDEAARSVIGKVGKQTRGVERMLRRIGFRYENRIDPFDGGPHFVAARSEVTLIRRSSRRMVTHEDDSGRPVRVLVARDLDQAPYFVALPSTVVLVGEDRVRLPEDTKAALSPGAVAAPEAVWILPRDEPSR